MSSSVIVPALVVAALVMAIKIVWPRIKPKGNVRDRWQQENVDR